MHSTPILDTPLGTKFDANPNLYLSMEPQYPDLVDINLTLI